MSRATISRVLRGLPGHSAETCRRVHEAAERLGYCGSPLVSAWMNQIRRGNPVRRQATVGLLNCLEDESQFTELPFFQRVLAGIRERGERMGFGFDRFWLPGSKRSPASLREVLRARGIHGVIALPASPGVEVSRYLELQGLAVVALGFSHLDLSVDRVAPQQFQGASLVVAELLERGYRRIGFAMRAQDDRRSGGRWSGGFAAALRYEELSAAELFTPERLDPATLADWLRATRPEVVVGLGAETLDRIRRAGFSVPEDFAYAALDADGAKGMAGLDQRHNALGAAAVDTLASNLFEQRTGLLDLPRHIMVHGRWREGATVPPSPSARR